MNICRRKCFPQWYPDMPCLYVILTLPWDEVVYSTFSFFCCLLYPLWFWSFYSIFFLQLLEREKERETTKLCLSSAHSLPQMPAAPRTGKGWSKKPGMPSGLSMWVTICCLPRWALAGGWVGNRAVRTKALHVPKQWLYPLHLNTAPSVAFVAMPTWVFLSPRHILCSIIVFYFGIAFIIIFENLVHMLSSHFLKELKWIVLSKDLRRLLKYELETAF